MLRQLLANLAIALATASVASAEAPVVKAMTDPQMGDHWTYAVRDEITGQTRYTSTQTVTEVRGEEISLRVTAGGRQTGFVTYDRQWNAKEANLLLRYIPHDGLGIKTPLAIGQTWAVDVKFETMKGNLPSWSVSRTAKVVGQGSVTTKAGRFDAFEIETRNGGVNGTNSGAAEENVVRTWYVPEINHWVKREREARVNGRLKSKETEELTEYGRREPD